MKRNVALALSILVSVLLLTFGTYAYVKWSGIEQNTTIGFVVDASLKEYIEYEVGNSQFAGDFAVGKDYTSGIYSTITVNKTESGQHLNLIAFLKMQVNKIGTNMSKYPGMKWTVTSKYCSNEQTSENEEVCASGNFLGVVDNDILTLETNIELTTTPKQFTVWVWADEAENPTDLMINEKLDTEIWMEIEQEVTETCTVTQANATYQMISATGVCSNTDITKYAVNTSSSVPSYWNDIPSTDQNNIYNLVTNQKTTGNNTSENITSSGTYYVWFMDEDGTTFYKQVAISSVESSGPVCTFTNAKDYILPGETTKIKITCLDSESRIVVTDTNKIELSEITATTNSDAISIDSISEPVTVTNGIEYVIKVTGVTGSSNKTVGLSLAASSITNKNGIGNAAVTGSIAIKNVFNISYGNCTSTGITSNYSATPTTYTYGNSVTLSTPTLTGYTFKNYYSTPECDGSAISEISATTFGDRKFYADWNANTYNINYNLNGGVSGANSPSTATYNQVVNISAPSKTFNLSVTNSAAATISETSKSITQTFNGWTATNLSTGTAKYGTSTDSVTSSWSNGNTAVNAQYFKNLRSDNGTTVTLNANWTTGNITLPTVTKTGYTCGYTATSTGTTIQYASGSEYTPSTTTNAVNLYTVCEANIRTVTFDYNNSYTFKNLDYFNTGYTVDWDKNFRIEETIKVSSIGNRHLIIGNYNGSDTKSLSIEITAAGALRVLIGTSQVDNAQGTITANENINVVFSWDAETNTYTISAVGTATNISFSGTYNVSGSSANTLRAGTQDYNMTSAGHFQRITVSSLKISTDRVYNTSLTMPTALHSYAQFNGFYTAASGGTQIGSSITVPDANVTYYAQWTFNKLTINYMKDGTAYYDDWSAVAGANSASCFNCSQIVFNSIKTGTYTFGGVEVNVSGEVSTTINYYTLTLNAGTGIASTTGGGVYLTGTTVDISATADTGYSFDRWSKTSGITPASTTSASTTVTLTTTTTLTANAVGNSYTITYYMGNGTSEEGFTAIGQSTCNYNSSCTLRTFADLGATFPQTSYGWEFSGWTNSRTGTSQLRADGATFTYTTQANIGLFAIGKRIVKFYSGIAPTTPTSMVNQFWNPLSTADTYLTAVTIPSATAIDSWTFIGYSASNTASSAAASYTVAQQVKYAYNAAIDFRGVYQRTVTIAYDGNGADSGSVSDQTSIQYYNSGMNGEGSNVTALAFVLAQNSFSKNGYIFNKWYDSGVSGLKFDAGANLYWTPVVNTTTITRTMYADWIASTPPEISFGTNGNSSYQKNASSTVTVTDSDGVASIEVAWLTEVGSAQGGTALTNGGTSTAPAVSGTYYLCVYAVDSLGTPANECSNAFYLDNDRPSSITINRSDYNTFTFLATDNVGVAGYYISTTNSTPSENASGWVNTTSYDISSAGTYYVWAKDTVGNVIVTPASITAYTISRSQGTGTTLTTRYDATSSTTGTEFTNNMVMLAGTSVWASASTSTGYGTATLKHGSTTMTASGSSFTVSATETITSTASDTQAPNTPTITRSDYNTFTYSSSDNVEVTGYYVSAVNVSTAPTTSSTWVTTTSKDISAAGTYYVWARDAAGNISSAASIVAYTISRSQGTGTTLTTRYDAISSSTGTEFTNSMVMLAGTSVWASATASTGYDNATLKHGSTTMTASGSSFVVNATETISSSASESAYTINYYMGNGTSTDGATLLGSSTCYNSSNCTLTSFANLNGTLPNSDIWWFAGWGTSSSTTDVTYNDGATFTYNSTSDMDLYAIAGKTLKFHSGIAPTTPTSTLYQYWNPYSTTNSYLSGVTIPSATAIDSWNFDSYETCDSVGFICYSIPVTQVGTSQIISITSSGEFEGAYSRTVTISYDGNGNDGGSTDSTSKTQTYYTGLSSNDTNVGSTLSSLSFTLAQNGFTKTGYSFTKWLDAYVSGLQFDAGATLYWTPAVDSTVVTRTMRAVWESSDSDGPVVTFGTNGSSSAAKSVSTTVTATDDSGVSSIQVAWLTSQSSAQGGTALTNGGTATKADGTGTYYLCVYATDNLGNSSNTCSNAFVLDNTPPVITINATSPCLEKGSTTSLTSSTYVSVDEGTLTASINGTTVSNISSYAPGSYNVIYSATDAAGNTATNRAMWANVYYVPTEANGSGLDNDGGRYMFKGANPNNYLYFNNQTWRIISKQYDGTYKIIYSGIYTEARFNSSSSGILAYTGTTIDDDLNSTFYWGMSETARSQLVAYNFPQGTLDNSIAGTDTSLNDIYEYYEKARTVNKYVALPTATDFFLASSNCEYWNTIWEAHSQGACKTNNWMLSSSNFHILNPASDTRSRYINISTGGLALYTPSTARGVRPTAYLKAGTKFTGSGTAGNPYMVSAACPAS